MPALSPAHAAREVFPGCLAAAQAHVQELSGLALVAWTKPGQVPCTALGVVARLFGWPWPPSQNPHEV
jgi:hypothetical protein